MDEIALKLCDIQGRLFELSAAKGYDSAGFVKAFMLSETAKALDSFWRKSQQKLHFLWAERCFPRTCYTGSAICIATGTSTPAKAARKSTSRHPPKL